MKNYTGGRFWLISCCLIFVMFISAGCFKSTNDADMDSTPVARALPSDTPMPTDTPEPTLTPTETPTESETEEVVTEEVEIPTEEVTDEFGAQSAVEPEVTFELGVTEVAQAENPGFDIPGSNPDQEDPDILTATQLIANATGTAAAMTETAQAPFLVSPFPTETPTFELFETPTSTPQQNTGNNGVPVSGSDCVHEVVAGENMFRLSLRYGVSIMDIANRSGVTNPNMIVVGQRLTIPGCGTTGVFPPPTSVSVDTTSGASTDNTSTAGTGSGGGQIHVVQQYETLFEISMMYNVPIMTIVSANNIANPNIIYFGQELVIP